MTTRPDLDSLMRYLFGPLGHRPFRSTIEWREARAMVARARASHIQ